MNAVILNARGTTNPSFRIHKNGPTLYQGSSTDIVDAPKEGDLFVKVGASSSMYQFQSGIWQEMGKVKFGTQSLLAKNNVNVASSEYVYYGTTNDATPTRLTLDGTPDDGEITVPANSSGHFQVSIVGSSKDHQHHLALVIKGLYTNISGGYGELLGSTADEVLVQTSNELASSVSIGIQPIPLETKFCVTVNGLPATDMVWCAFVHITSVSGLA
jgi:hypothetical protein